MNIVENRRFQIINTLVIVVIFSLSIYDSYRARINLSLLLGKLTLEWWLALLGLAAFFLVIFGGALLTVWYPERVRRSAINLRTRLGRLRWPIAVLIAGVPVYLLLFTRFGNVFTSVYLRFIVFVTTSILLGIMTTSGETRLIRTANLYFGILLVGTIIAVGGQLASVTNHPFALFWSEGNRLYDYSVSLGSDRYNYPGRLSIPYAAPGRYLLWGILFAVPDTPIWLHRLWNAILATVPYLLLGVLIARWSKFSTLGKWGIALWTLLFLTQGPIYTPLGISAIIVVTFVRSDNFLVSLIAVAVASYYATSSRWTWLPAVPTWASLILISNFKFISQEKWYRSILRLLPIAILAAAGLEGGILSSPVLSAPTTITSNMSFEQPLLWYRLLPNATYMPGILLGLVLATGPLVALLAWMALNKRWALNWLQGLAYTGACLTFLMMGLVASVKIGGGSDLHNLDMLLVTLVIISGLMLRGRSGLLIVKWPVIVQGLLLFAIFLPAWNGVSTAAPLQLPPHEEVVETLNIIDKKVNQALKRGEVLFMDQRQLLTFGYLNDIPLVSEYEKKFLMDQAMAGNSEYFKGFYADLADKRFSLIISDPLFISEKGQAQRFGEENDAWTTWVAEPVLCYYAPVNTIPSLNVQLLVPKANPVDCPNGF